MAGKYQIATRSSPWDDLGTMRRVLIALRGDWMPLPIAFVFIFGGIVGIDLLFDGRIHPAGAIGGAFGGTIGTAWGRQRRQAKGRDNT
jgi:hypothetical protein